MEEVEKLPEGRYGERAQERCGEAVDRQGMAEDAETILTLSHRLVSESPTDP